MDKNFLGGSEFRIKDQKVQDITALFSEHVWKGLSLYAHFSIIAQIGCALKEKADTDSKDSMLSMLTQHGVQEENTSSRSVDEEDVVRYIRSGILVT